MNKIKVICISNCNTLLVKGQVYDVSDENDYYGVYQGSNTLLFPKKWFKTIEQHREEQIQHLLLL